MSNSRSTPGTVFQSSRVPEDLWRRVKRVTAEIRGATIQQLVVEGLELRVKQLEGQITKKAQQEAAAR